MKYIRRQLQEVEWIKEENGVVTYLNEYKATCYMCTALFNQFYIIK